MGIFRKNYYSINFTKENTKKETLNILIVSSSTNTCNADSFCYFVVHVEFVI